MIDAIGKNVNAYTYPLQVKQDKINFTSQPDEFVKQDDNQEEKKGLSKKAKWGIAGGILAIGGIITAAILTKGKTLKPANFAEHIEFKPAQTMEEAIEFAKKNFGIKRFEFDNDLEFANWVNEGLVNINNRFKGKANIPEVFRFKSPEEVAKSSVPEAVAWCRSGSKHPEISFNREYINGSIDRFKKLTEDTLKPYFENGEIFGSYHIGADRTTHSKILELYQKLHNTPNEVNRFEALNGCFLFDDYVGSLKYFNKNKLDILKNKILNNEDAIRILKENNLSVKFEDYCNLPEEQLKSKISQIVELVCHDVPITETATVRGNGKFGVFYHEMGHYLHKMNTSPKDGMWGVLTEKAEKEFVNNTSKQNTAGLVSWYAQTKPIEFVAETFSALCAGKKLPDEVMKLYEHYKGPMLPNI